MWRVIERINCNKIKCKKNDISFRNTHCHVDGSDYIVFKKGDGELIKKGGTIYSPKYRKYGVY